jgi:catalase
MNPVNVDPSSLPGPPPLGTANRIARLALIALMLLGLMTAFASAAGWLRPRALTPERMIDAFERTNGQHSGFRRNHAKGVCVMGYFESNGQGVALSRAVVFRPGRVPVVGRFAIPGGQPDAADTPNSVRSMALLFSLPNGEQWRTGMNDIPVFLTNTPQAFYEQLVAAAPDAATGKPNPARMTVFLAENPSSARALQLIRNRPKTAGFESSRFNSLNSFRFTNAAGELATVRWSMVPTLAASPPEPAQTAPNYLFDQLIAAVHRAPVTWQLIVIVAEAGDAVDDATIAWPSNRRQINVGTLTIEQIESEDTNRARDINFDPLVLPDGMAPSDDPLLSARSAAYSESFTRRESERKEHSAVGSAEVGK